MERDELKGKQTPGTLIVTDDDGELVIHQEWSNAQGTDWATADMCGHLPGGEEEIHANAALYAEAHNVANETNMWPRDMEARIKELEGAANLMVAFINASPCDPDITAEQTIAYGEMMDNAAARALLNK